MPAVATDSLKKLFSTLLLSDVQDSNNQYYVGFGKADLWDSDDDFTSPVRSDYEEMLARTNLHSIKKISNTSSVVPRYNWSSGTVFSGWDNNQQDYPVRPYYVMTEVNEVYLCLKTGKDANGLNVASTVQPNYATAGVSIHQAFTTSDGYVWKFLYTIGAASASKFLSASFIPVEKVLWDSFGDSSGLSIDQLDQLVVQQSSIGGQITGVEIVNGGTGYTSAPTIVFDGNGSNAAATATISGGTIIKVDMDNDSSAFGSNYDVASITVSGGAGSGAVLRPIITPTIGLGADPRDDLKASSAMLNTVVDGADGSGDFVAGDQDFRQITVFKNIKTPAGAAFTDVTGSALRKLQLSSVSEAASFTADNVISGDETGAKGHIVKIESDDIYYQQNENTGFIQFNNSETVSEVNGNGTGTITAKSDGEVDIHSGELLYLENRSKIIRNTSQQEDIKVVITL